MRHKLPAVVLTFVAAGLVLIGIIVGGRQFRGRLRDDPRYQFPVHDIQCAAPPGQPLPEFLREVQYMSELADTVSLLDAHLPAQLSAAFARHPWVERVEQVTVGPGRNIRVTLTFRTAVLAVRFGAVTRAVDSGSVLLPLEAHSADLPRLTAAHPAPQLAGARWGDALVASASHLAGFLHPYRAQLRIADFKQVDDNWLLLLENGAIITWGHAPGAEATGEATAVAKRDQLLNRLPVKGALDLRKPP